MKFNPRIDDEINQAELTLKEKELTKLYLICSYLSINLQNHGVVVPQKIMTFVSSSDIFSFVYDEDDNHKLEFEEPLFVDENYSSRDYNMFWWVQEYRGLFKEVNKDRASSPSTVKKAFTRFINEYEIDPIPTGEEMIQCAKMYLYQLSDPQFCKRAHFFIIKGTKVNSESVLYSYLEELRNKGQDKYIGTIL